MSRLVGISTISFDNSGVGEQVDERVRVWENLIDTASLDGPDIILLPEQFIFTGMSFDKHKVAELLPSGGKITKCLSKRAKRHQTYIFASYYRKDKKGLYNSAVLFNRKGEIAGIYDKTFPTIWEMQEGILPGKGAKVFKTDFGTVGAMICFDFNFKELFTEYKKKKVELICFLSAFRAGFMIPSAAFENQVFIASATPRENSVIVDPLGHMLAESSTYGRVIFSKINLDYKIVHIDYNQEKVKKLKEKHKEYVKIEVASPEAVYLISSLHPKKNIEEMLEGFRIETKDEYLKRARRERKKYLLKQTGLGRKTKC